MKEKKELFMFQLLEGLQEQIRDYQGIPFWSWNDKLEEERLKEQVDWIQQMGMGGFFMHARGGLKTPYLSEEWMHCIDVCAQAARERGIKAWVYDENGWPSGFAGGKLLKKEENRDAFITHTIGAYDPLAWLCYSMEGEDLRRIKKPEGGECLNLFLHISPCTADILNPEVVEQFLAETHEKYAKRYGEGLSDHITGFFTDEPQYYRWNTAYTRMMPEAFRERFGEDLFDSLGLLFVKKAGYRRFRYRYWHTMQQLMLTGFAQRVYEWCEEHGVCFTGHYVEEVSLGMQMICCAGVMPFYEYLHMPGIDWLNRTVGNEIPLRQVNSAARQMGKKQIISEMFGCCGWDVTPMELRRIADFQYVGGVNRMCHHLIPYSERGQRKRDYPAHFSPINPWVKEHFRTFNDYYTRLGYVLANTEEKVKVAMLHPMRSAYLEFQYTSIEEGFGIGSLEKSFYDQQEQLARAQIPFHFLDETLLERHGFVRGDKIGCGQCEYEYLVISTCYCVGAHTEKLLRQYVEQGGRLLLMDEKPSYLEGESYDFSYLASNISFEALSEWLPYRLKEPVSQVHSTLRRWEDGWLLFVQNYGEETKKISYELREGYRSFERWDMTTMTSAIVPTEITLAAGESCILLFSKEMAKGEQPKPVVHLPGRAQVVSATENYLTLDEAQYSKDGIHYSEHLPCMGIFQKLLEERYEGPLYVRYSFQVRTNPPQIALIVEKGQGRCVTVNGHSTALTGLWERDHQILKDDITPWVKEGQNEIVCQLFFHQSEDVYYALFGENVTESLRNCLCYDTELEAIYLAGDFGVYGEEFVPGKEPGILLGQDFYIDGLPDTVENIITEGYPFFSGKMTLKQSLTLTQREAVLEYQGRFQAVTVWVNGQKAGTMLYHNRLDISPYTKIGENEIVTELIVGNRNLLGPHHRRTQEEPKIVGPYSFELPGSWENGRSSQYRDSYAFVPVPLQ